MQNKFFGSKLNTLLLFILIILMVFALRWMSQDREKYFGKFTKNNNYSWEDVITFANNCEIASGWQAHNLDVQVVLKNGEEFLVKEPILDEIFSLLWKNNDKCGEVPFATE
jgi:hypothetical protein